MSCHVVSILSCITYIAVGVDLRMPRVTIIGVAFAVSSSMALPFSSFPNVNSVQILVT